jgi:5'-nucleotidase
MQILLTNDDGIYAPGLAAMERQLRQLGNVEVVAPLVEQSGVGHAITYLTPLMARELFDGERRRGWAVEGSPADCVKLAISELCRPRPDLVVSGINSGQNAGINVLYSGTVAAAIEGAFFRVTSIACSLEYTKLRPLDFLRGAILARGVVEQILRQRPPTGSLFNVNIPSLDRGPVRGVRVLPQNLAPYVEGFDRRTDPRGRVYFWTTPDFSCPDPHPDTDVTALAEGYITVTPLQFNLTDAGMLKAMGEWEWSAET